MLRARLGVLAISSLLLWVGACKPADARAPATVDYSHTMQRILCARLRGQSVADIDAELKPAHRDTWRGQVVKSLQELRLE